MEQRIRVLHVCPSFWPNIGGIERFILDLAQRTTAAGAQVSVLTLNAGEQPGDRLPARDVIQGIPVRRVPFVDLRYYKPALLPVSMLRAADVLHVHNVGAMLDAVVATRPLHRSPVVVSTHGGIFHTGALSGAKRAYFYGLQPLVARGVDLFVADSRPDLELFQRISDRNELIELGVAQEELAGYPIEGREQGRYLFVGRLSRNKGLDNLLRAFAALGRRGVSFQLRIVGPDWERIRGELERLRGQLGLDGQVVFTGAVSEPDLRDELRRAEFFVSASKYEGFGLSAIEAMAAGCIPILNRIDSFVNFVHDGENGILADFADPERAADQIAALQNRDRPALARAARASAHRFSWTVKTGEWMDIYGRVAAGRRA